MMLMNQYINEIIENTYALKYFLFKKGAGLGQQNVKNIPYTEE